MQGQSSAVFKGLQHLPGSASLQVLGSCTGAPAVIPATAEALRQHLALGQEGPAVAVICAEGGPEDEGLLLSEAQAAVAALTDKFVMVHTIGGQAGGQVGMGSEELGHGAGGRVGEGLQGCSQACGFNWGWHSIVGFAAMQRSRMELVLCDLVTR